MSTRANLGRDLFVVVACGCLLEASLLAVTISPVVAFPGGPDGGRPDHAMGGGLLLAQDGSLYGTTTERGDHNAGTLFRLTTNSVLTTLHSFDGPTDGSNARGRLIQGVDGHLYGTASRGGTHNRGTVYRITTNGAFTVLHSFNGSDGAESEAGLVRGDDGFFYGTSRGGPHLAGTIFKLTTNGVLTTLHAFNGFTNADRGFPSAGLVKGNDGALYGTTGTYLAGYPVFFTNHGSVFRCTTNGILTTLYYFTGGADGNAPGGLLEGSDGDFYGISTTKDSFGGTLGTVFRLTTSGQFTTLHTFSGGADGKSPGGLVQARDGALVGVTGFGGAEQRGTVFRITPDGSHTTLGSFTWRAGAVARGQPVELEDNVFFGAAPFSGWNSLGTVYRVNLLPQINLQPTSRTNYTGTTADFAASVDAFEPATFQWSKDNDALADTANITGSSTTSLTLTSVSLTDAGAYSLRATDAFGAVTSVVAVLTVLSQSPLLLTGPDSRTELAGASTALQVSAVGSLPLTYQWRKDGTNLVDGGNVAGATTSTLTLDPLLPEDAGAYSVLVTNAVGSLTSSNGQLTVLPAIITTHPEDRTVLAGDTLTLGVYVDSTVPVNFQWLKGALPLSDGGNFSGTTDSSLTVSKVAVTDGGVYSVMVSNEFGSVQSPGAMVTVIHTVPLAEALNTPSWEWTTSQYDPWFGQTNTAHDGYAAAQSSLLLDEGGGPWIETTLPGPGVLSFWWKALTDDPCPTVWFSVNGVTQANRINGTADWRKETILLADGPQTVRWRFDHDCFYHPGDAAWVDQVQFFSTQAPVIESATAADEAFALRWTSVPGQTYQVQSIADLEHTNWSNVGGLILATNTLTSASEPLGTNSQRLYRVVLLQ